MDAFSGVLNLVWFIIVVFLISRVAAFFRKTTSQLDEITKKLDELNKRTE